MGRWVGILRALTPTLAGMGRMPYRRFLIWNAVGGGLWASTVVLVGYGAGTQYVRVEHVLRQASLGLAVLAVTATGGGLARLALRRRRRRREESAVMEPSSVLEPTKVNA